MITPPQIRAARSLTGLTQAELAREAGLSATALGAIESGDSDPKLSTVTRLVEALEARGVVFSSDGGVRLHKSP
jgi:predicted transcriptional regulator